MEPKETIPLCVGSIFHQPQYKWIEITCRGQQLLPFLTLQHVRDNIWTQRDNTTQQRALLSDSSTTDHVMVLHYGRSTS